MGYFSNGAEGTDYEETYCSKCLHWDGGGERQPCAVWMAHIIHNYKEANNPDSVLHTLIPREGINNGKCKMLIEEIP